MCSKPPPQFWRLPGKCRLKSFSPLGDTHHRHARARRAKARTGKISLRPRFIAMRNLITVRGEAQARLKQMFDRYCRQPELLPPHFSNLGPRLSVFSGPPAIIWRE